MEYCPVCKNLYDITHLSSTQTISPHDDTNILDKSSKSSNIISDTEFNVTGIPSFICLTCNKSEPIPPNTLLFTKSKSKNYLNYDDTTIGNPEQKHHNPVLLKTKNYLCPNKLCPTHKSPQLKSASIERFDYQTYKVYYTCNVCNKQWY